MALMKCFECGKKVSTSAVVCPNCGYPIAEPILTKDNAVEKRKQLLDDFYLADDDSIDEAERKIIETLSYSEKSKKKKSLLLISILIFLIGISLIIYPIATRQGVLASERFRLFFTEDNIEEKKYVEERLQEAKELLEQNPQLSYDEVNEIYNEQIDDHLAPRVFIRQLPFFVGGVLFIFISVILFRRSKKFTLLGVSTACAEDAGRSGSGGS
ncbi:MAG: zinc ribbon domain-containing protein [Syntrophomonadaceae bacterium]|nr:zinc ribbon domain-containing protein [Syntrophomonadaceae bacterium]